MCLETKRFRNQKAQNCQSVLKFGKNMEPLMFPGGHNASYILDFKSYYNFPFQCIRIREREKEKESAFVICKYKQSKELEMRELISLKIYYSILSKRKKGTRSSSRMCEQYSKLDRTKFLYSWSKYSIKNNLSGGTKRLCFFESTLTIDMK